MSYFDNLILLAMAQGSNSPIATKEGVIEAINNAIAALPRGLIYKGAVDYYSNLPASPEVGDCYTVRYEGDSGTTPNGKEYAWGPIDNVNQWIDLGPDLSGFVEKQTTTQAFWRIYAYNNNGDNFLSTIPGLDGTTAPTATGGVATTTSGRLRTNTPTGPYHAANKKYVDDNCFKKAVVTPSLSTYQDINGYTWQELYTAMQNAGAAQIYLNNADRWLHFGSNQADTICNQIVTFAFDEILGNKFFFVLKYVKEQAGTQTIQEIQCSITSTGVISAISNIPTGDEYDQKVLAKYNSVVEEQV